MPLDSIFLLEGRLQEGQVHELIFCNCRNKTVGISDWKTNRNNATTTADKGDQLSSRTTSVSISAFLITPGTDD